VRQHTKPKTVVPSIKDTAPGCRTRATRADACSSWPNYISSDLCVGEATRA